MIRKLLDGLAAHVRRLPAIAAALGLLLQTARAGAHDAAEPFADWFNSLTMPDSSVSCCHRDHDCGATDYRMTERGYEVLVAGEWIVVPAKRVLHRDNPTGRGVLCSRPGIIYCFVPADDF